MHSVDINDIQADKSQRISLLYILLNWQRYVLYVIYILHDYLLCLYIASEIRVITIEEERMQ